MILLSLNRSCRLKCKLSTKSQNPQKLKLEMSIKTDQTLVLETIFWIWK